MTENTTTDDTTTGKLSTADFASGNSSSGIQTETRPAAGTSDTSDQPTPLFTPDESETFQTRWEGVQTKFVDDPRKAVEDADSLVAEAMKTLAEKFAEERSSLEQQWQQGEDVSTEDLRQALQRYRSFFQRLLSA